MSQNYQDKPKRLRGRPRTFDTEHVVDTAVEAYWRRDPADVSINEICQMARVSKPSLYREFGNEDGFICAALDSYAERILSDIFAILQSGKGLQRTLEALTEFACDDPRMETGCLFLKMRAGKHRLGPATRARLDELDAAAQSACMTFLQDCQNTGEWASNSPIDASARYLKEQIGLAITQRSSGEEEASVRQMLDLALSVFTRS